MTGINKVHSSFQWEDLTVFFYIAVIGSNLFSVRFNALSSVGKSDSLAQRLIKAAEEVNGSTVKADNGLRLWRWIDTPLYKSIKRNIGLLERSVLFAC